MSRFTAALCAGGIISGVAALLSRHHTDAEKKSEGENTEQKWPTDEEIRLKRNEEILSAMRASGEIWQGNSRALRSEYQKRHLPRNRFSQGNYFYEAVIDRSSHN